MLQFFADEMNKIYQKKGYLTTSQMYKRNSNRLMLENSGREHACRFKCTLYFKINKKIVDFGKKRRVARAGKIQIHFMHRNYREQINAHRAAE